METTTMSKHKLMILLVVSCITIGWFVGYLYANQTIKKEITYEVVPMNTQDKMTLELFSHRNYMNLDDCGTFEATINGEKYLIFYKVIFTWEKGECMAYRCAKMD